jgi:hypothetical protein
MAERSGSVGGVVRAPRFGPVTLTPAMRLRVAFVRARTTELTLPVVFALASLHNAQVLTLAGQLGLEFRASRTAAGTLLAGGDPWVAGGGSFVGLPAAVLAYVPATLLPESIGAAIWFLVGLAAATYVVRSLQLPYWWLLFPPITAALALGTVDLLVVALAVASGRHAGFAVALRPQAAIPLVWQRRFGAIALAATVLVVGFVFWPRSASSLVTGVDPLAAVVWLSWAVAVVAALAAMRRSGGEWLAAPALLPFAPLAWATIALPGLRHRPVVALTLALSYPAAVPIAIVGQAAWEVTRGRRPHATPQPAAVRRAVPAAELGLTSSGPR